ncbi:MAG: uracil-DNA glycosylase [Monoglobales bacterium]
MLSNDWNEILKKEFQKEYFVDLMKFLNGEYKRKRIFPPKDKIFAALELSSYENTKVVIMGQDPYHGAGQAHGLCFSVNPGVALPPSLKNIFKELQDDVGISPPEHGCLTKWAEQGILMLNATLTVEEFKPNSHSKLGWDKFTNKIIENLNEREKPVIFILWGNNAREKLELITGKQHYVLLAAHPSPLSASRGFFGCKHFSKINLILEQTGQQKIDWQL